MIRDSFDQVDLRFSPIVDVPNHLNLGVMNIDYHGPIGWVEGRIRDGQGTEFCFDQFIGMGEQKYIRM